MASYPKAFISSDINNILDSIHNDSFGVAYANRFQVLISAPRWGEAASGVDYQMNISLRCEQITLSGRSLATYPYRIYGPARNIPYEAIYAGELQTTFLLDSNLLIKSQFESWMDMIVSRPSYKLEFYDNYIGSMEISMINKEDRLLTTWQFEGVYPKLVGDMQLGYDKDNEVMRLDVTFCFRSYQLVEGLQKTSV